MMNEAEIRRIVREELALIDRSPGIRDATSVANRIAVRRDIECFELDELVREEGAALGLRFM
jgi:hypothetical protein